MAENFKVHFDMCVLLLPCTGIAVGGAVMWATEPDASCMEWTAVP